MRSWRKKTITNIWGVMSKVILMMILAIVSNSAVAEWVKFGSNDNETMTAYIDAPSIGKPGKRVKMWILYDFITATAKAGKTYMSVRQQSEFDCKEEKMRILYVSYHSGNMARGEIISSSLGSKPMIWAPVPPESLIQSQWNIACKQ